MNEARSKELNCQLAVRHKTQFIKQTMVEDNDRSPVKVENATTVGFGDDDSNANNDDPVVSINQSIGDDGQTNVEMLRQQSVSYGDMNNDPFHAFVEQSRVERNALIDRIETLEATHGLGDSWNDNDIHNTPFSQDSELGKVDDVSSRRDQRRSISKRQFSIIRRQETPWKYQRFPFPESTYTLMITEGVLSLPFAVGLVTTSTSLMCLGITLKYELDNASDGNPYGMPAGVPAEVRMAQFLGIVVGEYFDFDFDTRCE